MKTIKADSYPDVDRSDVGSKYDMPTNLRERVPGKDEEVDWEKPVRLKKKRVYQLGIDIPSVK